MLLISGVMPAGTYVTITRNPTFPGQKKKLLILKRVGSITLHDDYVTLHDADIYPLKDNFG